MDEWSVLTTSEGPRGSPIPTAEQLEQLRWLLPGDDAWVQYPRASGRGHAIELRFWTAGRDALDATVGGLDLAEAALRGVGLDGWRHVRVHGASAEERRYETTPGLDARADQDVSDEWAIFIRLGSPPDAPPIDERRIRELLTRLPGPPTERDSRGGGHLFDLHFWLRGADAVGAAVEARRLVMSALATVGLRGWTFLRIMTTSPSEARRGDYPGTDARARGRIAGTA